MDRFVIKTIIKLCAEAVAFAAVVGVVIGIIGYIRAWDSAVAYSNAFFLAGCLVIIAGTSTRMAASEDGSRYQIYSESFRDMSRSERSNYIINASSSMRLAILGLLSGMMLILIAAISAYLL